MRQIGTVVNASDAARFVDYLLTLGIRSRADAGDAGAAVWVYDEDQIQRAAGELAQFNANPSDARYAAATTTARQIAQQAAEAEKQYRKNVVEVRDRWRTPSAGQRPVTLALIGISVVVTVFSHFGKDVLIAPWTRELTIELPLVENGEVTDFLPLSDTFRSGQLWRLITPIFLHFGPMHLLFNAFAMIDLGSRVEILRGSWRMLFLAVSIAIISNVAQCLQDGAFFGGLSGVAYGLFGYIWMKSLFEPRCGLFLDSQAVFVMLLWFVLCYTGTIGSVANTAHAAGLASGIVIGIAPTVRRRLIG